jgi:hypothetical protein
MRTTVSSNFRTFVLNKYPALQGNQPYLRFFRYLCFGTFHDASSHRLVIPTKVMAKEIFEVSTNNFIGKDALEKFKSEVLPGLTWTAPAPSATNGWKGKAREFVDLGFDEEMEAALKQELLSPSKDRVDFITGGTHEREDRYQQMAEETAAYEEALASCSLNETQAKVVNYLRRIKAGHLFLRKLDENQEAIVEAMGHLSPEVQTIRYRILGSARENPNVYYLPSSKGNTCRISGQGDSILGLKKEVRKAATAGWVECDLRSSQFAILAAKLKAPVSQAFIASGKSIWREFYSYLVGLDADPPSDTKAVMKEAMYSLCFGKSKANLRKVLDQHQMGSLLRHPILSELLQLREKWFEQINLDGGAKDVWGVWHAVDRTRGRGKKGRWAGSVAATVIQSIEMEIIAPIFDVAMEHGKSDQFGICLFQHDGATLSFQSTEKQARAQTKLKKAVEARAKALGVETVLEFTQL